MCPKYGGVFQGECYHCGQWGHQARSCTAQQAHVSTDEYERAEDGYPYHQYSDYYDVYNKEKEECETNSQHGLYSLMVRVLGDTQEKAMAAGHVSKYDINLDCYCTRHMTPCLLLEQQQPCVVGNKEKLSSTHKENMRLGNIVFSDVLFVPGLLQTLISEPHAVGAQGL